VGVPDNQLRQQGWLADEQVYAKWPKRRGRSRLVIVGSACAPDAAVHTAKLLQALRVTPQARSVCPARQPDGKCLNDALCPPFTSHGASICSPGVLSHELLRALAMLRVGGTLVLHGRSHGLGAVPHQRPLHPIDHHRPPRHTAGAHASHISHPATTQGKS
jgi:hypothetical protein